MIGGDVGYFIHRVGPDGPVREANIEAAKLWIRWLLAVTELAVSAPWLAYVISCDETTYRARGLRDGITFANMSPIRVGIICGPEVSDGCGKDRDVLLERSIGVMDLTPMGLTAPPPAHERGLWLVAFERWLRLVSPTPSPSRARILRVHGPGRSDLDERNP